jgi:16S rRNA (cytidine1402-2'-O)-methyltransferase
VPLVLCGTPIGDVSDASPRLRATLSAAHVIAAEDTRRFRDLARRLDIDVTSRVISYFAGNESGRIAELIEALQAGATVALVTDAGMPGVSDPGYLLVRAAVAANLPVTVVPGPSSVTTALAMSGLPSERFAMEGFLPRKPGERRKLLASLAREPRTLVVLESPHRIAATLDDLVEAFGADRPAALCREMTKTYEQVIRGGLGDIAAAARETQLKGEITLVIAGAEPEDPTATADLTQVKAAVAVLVAAGSSTRDAVTAVSTETGIARKVVYAAATGAKIPDLR